MMKKANKKGECFVCVLGLTIRLIKKMWLLPTLKVELSGIYA